MRLNPNRLGSFRLAWGRAGRRAFTLLEMLIVLIIIAIIASLALPHIRGNTESVAINAACRQLVADFSFARQRAMATRSTVAVVFVPREVRELNWNSSAYTPREQAEIKRLHAGSYTHYALFTYRKTGDQPGNHQNLGYITEWKSLPEKTFVEPLEFDDTSFFFRNGLKFPFPFSTSIPFGIPPGLPYIAFDQEGRCIRIDRDETGAGVLAEDRILRVARGSILYSRESDGTILDQNFDVQQIPPFNSTNNVIHVDALTGRAKRLELQLQ
jgi:prepilin-type N-terminal cleavage/methylation domain-containing protein